MKRKEVITTVKKMVVCLAIPLTMSLTCGSTTALAQTTPKISQTTKKNSKKKKLNKKSKSALAKKKLKKKSKRISKIRIKGKAADNHNKLKLDSNNNLVILKGPYKDCKLKTNSKKIKLNYWGFSPANSRWEIITKKSGKAKIKVIKNGKTIKEFKVIVKKPRISAKTTKNSVNLKLENVGNRYGITLHNVKWVFTPVNTEQDSNTTTESPDNSDTTIVEGNTAITLAQSVATTAPSPITNRQRSAKVTIIKPGTYRVQATLLGKTYTLNKTVTVPEIDYSTRW
ncbi:hypothetical protein [Anaerobutyricum soehngenii]|uniref:hypothetical protein n=1 Tax=Anaerobutyricum soehngenii TaxID=105843 RepID=UPI0032C0BFA1